MFTSVNHCFECVNNFDRVGGGHLGIENKLDISGSVKHRIPGFSKLVGLSTTRHEKLCIALLQRLEAEMEATNVLHRKVMGSQKVAKSKNKGRRELRNLISSVNYDGR